MNKDYLSGKIFEDILQTGRFTVNGISEKYELSKRYVRKMIIQPLKNMKLIKIEHLKKDKNGWGENTDERTECYTVDKKEFLKRLPRFIQTKSAKKTVKLFEYLINNDRITATHLQKELNWSWDKIINTLNKLEQEGYLILKENKEYEKNPDKIEELFIKRPRDIFGGELTEATKEEIKEAYKSMPIDKIKEILKKTSK